MKIEGLIGGDTGEIDTETDISMKEDIESSHTQETIYQESVLEDFEDNEKLVAPAKRISKADRSVVVVSNASNMEAKAAVDDLVEKTENGWMCKPCGKTTSNRKTALSDLRRHAEIHIEGLSFDCQLCDKTFRSRNSFNSHKSGHHTY